MENLKDNTRPSSSKLNTIIDEEMSNDFSSDEEKIKKPSKIKQVIKKDKKPRTSVKTVSELQLENEKLKSTIMIFKQKLQLKDEDITD